MKKVLKTSVAVLLTICTAVSLSSCSFFATMREYSKKASEVELLPTPEDRELLETFAKAVDVSAASAEKLSESVSYDTSDFSITNAAENTGILEKGADIIAGLIGRNNPGKSDREIELPSLEDTLLSSFDAASALTFETNRNMSTVVVTDENGEDLTDEEGKVISEEVFADNNLSVEFRFFNDTVTEEAYTDTDGNNVDAVTERSYADAALIKTVFGEDEDKAEVLANFDVLKDYFTVESYDIEYTDCNVSTTIDLSTDCVSGVSFNKVMKVTAKVTGTGSFESYGEMTLTFRTVKTTDYSFTYPVAE